MDNNNPPGRILWLKSLWNGVVSLILGFVIYMIPGLAVAFKMAFELGPATKNSNEVSVKISSTVSQMYMENIWLTAGFIIVMSIMILWRSRRVIIGSANKSMINGLLVGLVPASMILLMIFTDGFNLFFLTAIFIFMGSGIIGTSMRKKITAGSTV